MSNRLFSPILIIPLFIFQFIKTDNYAPAPRGIAINNVSRECGYYWGGDEYISYELSNEWEIFYPNENYDGFESKYGNCAIDDKFTYEKCCKQLGFTFIPGNLGEVLGIRKESDLLKTKISNPNRNISIEDIPEITISIYYKVIIIVVLILVLGLSIAFIISHHISKTKVNKKNELRIQNKK
jgi:hypothetical protein